MWRATAEALVAYAFVAGAALPAQTLAAPPRLDVAITAAPHRGKLPALVWFAESWLPGNARWHAGASPRDALLLTLRDGQLEVQALASSLPEGIAIAGAATFGDTAPALWQCQVDGEEDWFVPTDWPLPTASRELLGAIDALVLDRPRTLATNVLVGHFAGALADGDSRRDLLQLAASHCGDVTWLAWKTPTQLRVRGRSDGGLVLPAALLWLATRDEARTDGLAVRAYAARDADRAEATRQLSRAPEATPPPALLAMLHADEEARLSAIDALVRRGAGDQLPAIVAAADPAMPAATLGAVDAVQLLWPTASPLARQRTRGALQRSPNMQLRAIDVGELVPRAPSPTAEPAPLRLRALLWLGLLALGLTVAWARERARSRALATRFRD